MLVALVGLPKTITFGFEDVQTNCHTAIHFSEDC